ncbi:FeoB-associated Cys-rich membrane protein [Endozoicomonas euniceicola]|uniref:FeoB-associated Cys-rich membrane protein n=1 Tax=Endozoicomonas euniceicola TaxID=1234143 RepID=A0ABY6GQS8_9GAMM|nr:FeoB-associated Cys-rich membrane protein [Endozoicomonas euniceicola]UYM14443.1 FeoB-associated Cys-rich membrane protein [Endozoicomonas euniceicola]
MYEQANGFLDILITAVVISSAAYYLYRKLWRKKNVCGSGCDSCPSATRKKHKAQGSCK